MAQPEMEATDHIQPDGSESTPNSPGGDAQGGLKAPKDKNCPFCGQAFTSSSLGRHLDLYIRPKNPKAPDGVHDVEKIRQMRGGITRRQPRTSLKGNANAEGGGTSWHSTGQHRTSEGGGGSGRMTDRSPINSPIQGSREDAQHQGTFVNAPSWHATGVINNLPARAPSRGYTNTPTSSSQAQRAQDMRKDSTGARTQRPDYGSDDMWKLQESAEVGKAAELALREVLTSLEAAKKTSHPFRLFDDFDFCQLSFPGLCLAMLPPPPTLFSSTPFAAAHTWPLNPPGEKQYTAMQRVMSEKVAVARNGNPDNLPDSTIFRYQVHLQGAWEHWQLLAEADQAVAWNLEVSRAFVREREKKTKLESELDYANQRIKHLESEFDRLSRCQLPREYLLYAPRTMPVDPATMREMRSTTTTSSSSASNYHDMDYDPDALISKWQSAIRATARPNPKPPVPRRDNSTTTPMYISETGRNPLRGDIMMQGSVFGVGGPMPRGEDLHGTPRDGRDCGVGGGGGGLQYETPERVGEVVEDGEAEGYGDHAMAGAMVVRDGIVNVNGKRPYGSGTPTGWGRDNGSKVVREGSRGRG